MTFIKRCFDAFYDFWCGPVDPYPLVHERELP